MPRRDIELPHEIAEAVGHRRVVAKHVLLNYIASHHHPDTFALGPRRKPRGEPRRILRIESAWRLRRRALKADRDPTRAGVLQVHRLGPGRSGSDQQSQCSEQRFRQRPSIQAAEQRIRRASPALAPSQGDLVQSGYQLGEKPAGVSAATGPATRHNWQLARNNENAGRKPIPQSGTKRYIKALTGL